MLEVAQWIITNWDFVLLIATNIVALFADKPQNWRKKR
jgi:hypothetical protein